MISTVITVHKGCYFTTSNVLKLFWLIQTPKFHFCDFISFKKKISESRKMHGLRISQISIFTSSADFYNSDCSPKLLRELLGIMTPMTSICLFGAMLWAALIDISCGDCRVLADCDGGRAEWRNLARGTAGQQGKRVRSNLYYILNLYLCHYLLPIR